MADKNFTNTTGSISFTGGTITIDTAKNEPTLNDIAYAIEALTRTIRDYYGDKPQLSLQTRAMIEEKIQKLTQMI